MITVVKSQPQNETVDFHLDIQVESIQAQNTTKGDNTYTTACNCTSTTSCIDDDRNPSRCPDD